MPYNNDEQARKASRNRIDQFKKIREREAHEARKVRNIKIKRQERQDYREIFDPDEWKEVE